MKNRSEISSLVLIGLSLTVVLTVYNDSETLKKVLAKSSFTVKQESKRIQTPFASSFDYFKSFQCGNNCFIFNGGGECIVALPIGETLLTELMAANIGVICLHCAKDDDILKSVKKIYRLFSSKHKDIYYPSVPLSAVNSEGKIILFDTDFSCAFAEINCQTIPVRAGPTAS